MHVWPPRRRGGPGRVAVPRPGRAGALGLQHRPPHRPVGPRGAGLLPRPALRRPDARAGRRPRCEPDVPAPFGAVRRAPRPTRPGLARLLASGEVDLLHFAGHGRSDDGGRPPGPLDAAADYRQPVAAKPTGPGSPSASTTSRRRCPTGHRCGSATPDRSSWSTPAASASRPRRGRSGRFRRGLPARRRRRLRRLPLVGRRRAGPVLRRDVLRPRSTRRHHRPRHHPRPPGRPRGRRPDLARLHRLRPPRRPVGRPSGRPHRPPRHPAGKRMPAASTTRLHDHAERDAAGSRRSGRDQLARSTRYVLSTHDGRLADGPGTCPPAWRTTAPHGPTSRPVSRHRPAHLPGGHASSRCRWCCGRTAAWWTRPPVSRIAHLQVDWWKANGSSRCTSSGTPGSPSRCGTRSRTTCRFGGRAIDDLFDTLVEQAVRGVPAAGPTWRAMKTDARARQHAGHRGRLVLRAEARRVRRRRTPAGRRARRRAQRGLDLPLIPRRRACWRPACRGSNHSPCSRRPSGWPSSSSGS